MALLRHTFATQLAASGKVSLRTLQGFLGHADAKPTQIYSHYSPSTHEVDMVNAAFAAERQPVNTRYRARHRIGPNPNQPLTSCRGPRRLLPSGRGLAGLGLTGADPGLG
jgi:Phage integrase family